VNPIEKPECGRNGSDEPTSHGEVSRTSSGPGEHRNHGNSPAQTGPCLGSNGLSAADKVVLLYLAIVAVLIASSYYRIEWWWLLVGLHLLVIASLIAVGRWFGPGASERLRASGSFPARCAPC